MNKIVIKILQGSVLTQTVLGGLTIIISSCSKFSIACNWLQQGVLWASLDGQPFHVGVKPNEPQ